MAYFYHVHFLFKNKQLNREGVLIESKAAFPFGLIKETLSLKIIEHQTEHFFRHQNKTVSAGSGDPVTKIS